MLEGEERRKYSKAFEYLWKIWTHFGIDRSNDKSWEEFLQYIDIGRRYRVN